MTRKLTPPSEGTMIKKLSQRVEKLERRQREPATVITRGTLEAGYLITSELRHTSDTDAFNGLKAVAAWQGGDGWAEAHLGPVLLDVDFRFLIGAGVNLSTVSPPLPATLTRDIIVANAAGDQVLRAFSVEDVDWSAIPYGNNDLPASGDWTVETVGDDLLFDESVSPHTGHVLSESGGVYWASLYIKLVLATP